MNVTIEVKQEIKNGNIQPKKYDLRISIPYGSRDIRWNKDAYLLGLDAETITELVTLLTRELENALKV